MASFWGMAIGASGWNIDPALGLIAAIAAITVLSMFALRAAARRTEASDPLTGLFSSETFDDRLNTAASQARHDAPAAPRAQRKTSVLTGRIDHLSQVRQVWGQNTRAEAIEQVAQVMRAGVRKTDTMARDKDESFVIIADGADEDEAGGIAQRLMQTLARTPVPGMDEGLHLTASFGVAERLDGESDADMHARAGKALKAAQDEGEDRIVAASEWEEVRFLPAPTPSGDKDSAVA